jgi:hypothetical protein
MMIALLNKDLIFMRILSVISLIDKVGEKGMELAFEISIFNAKRKGG